MAKRGPVPRYKPDFCPIAYKFCLLGATNDDLAGLLEVSRATIGNWLARIADDSGLHGREGYADAAGLPRSVQRVTEAHADLGHAVAL